MAVATNYYFYTAKKYLAMKQFNVTGTCYPDDHYMVDISYLLSFCFNQNKQLGVRTIKITDKEIIEVVV